MTPDQERLLAGRTDAHSGAVAALAGRRRAMHREIEEATAAVRAAHAAPLAALQTEVVRARDQLDATRIEISRTSPLAGLRVACPDIPARGFGQRPQPARRGIVEVWTPGDTHSGRSAPHPGQLVVRVLRRDGRPGTGTIAMTGEQLPLHWSAE